MNVLSYCEYSIICMSLFTKEAMSNGSEIICRG